MQTNSGNFSLEDMKALAASPAARQLMAMLQQADPAVLRKAMESAAGGDLSRAKADLAPLLASEEAKKLLEQLGG